MKLKVIYTAFFALLIVIISCQNNVRKKDLTSEEKEAYLEKGQQITNETFTTLAKELQRSLKEGGVAHAVDYCKLHAIPLVDSLSKIHNVEIRRASLKTRNPLDKATKKEADILKNYEAQLKQKEPIEPFVKLNKTKSISYYAPIMVNEFCLQCHGEVGETLKREDYGLISEKYPNDQAIGYNAGDLRGMWRVTFKK